MMDLTTINTGFVVGWGEFFIENILLTLLLPVWVALIILVNTISPLVQSRRLTLGMTLLSTGICAVFAFGILAYNAMNGVSIETNYNWLSFGQTNFYFGILADNLSALLLVILTTVSFLVQLYSFDYMKDDKSFHKFFVYLNLFNFSMTGLVISSNLIQTYIFWELVGVSSYLLIGFWFNKKSASDGAQKAFIINRIGDCGLLVGIIALVYFMMNYSSGLESLTFSNMQYIAESLYALVSDPIFYVVCFMLLMGSIAKSAQFPLHVWLADAMEAPTPISALIHAATMVAAGVYLVVRLMPMFQMSPMIMSTILYIGLFTALFTGLIACVQYDVKKMLAYSTCSQLGLMFVALGVSSSEGGLFHLTTHAYFKALLFLCAGAVIVAFHHLQDMRYMGCLRKQNPLLAGCFLVGVLSLSGFFLSGFFSKELILTQLLTQGKIIELVIALIVTFLSAFYIFRGYFMIFEGRQKNEQTVANLGNTLVFPLIILSVVSIFLGAAVNKYFAQNQHTEMILPVLSVGLSAIAVFLVFILFKLNKLKRFLPKFLHKLIYNRFYMDELYLWLERVFVAKFARLCDYFDKYFIDGVVNLSAFLTRVLSWGVCRLQTGNFQSYLLYSFCGIAVLMFSVFIVYFLMMKG